MKGVDTLKDAESEIGLKEKAREVILKWWKKEVEPLIGKLLTADENMSGEERFQLTMLIHKKIVYFHKEFKQGKHVVVVRPISTLYDDHGFPADLKQLRFTYINISAPGLPLITASDHCCLQMDFEPSENGQLKVFITTGEI